MYLAYKGDKTRNLRHYSFISNSLNSWKRKTAFSNSDSCFLLNGLRNSYSRLINLGFMILLHEPIIWPSKMIVLSNRSFFEGLMAFLNCKMQSLFLYPK